MTMEPPLCSKQMFIRSPSKNRSPSSHGVWRQAPASDPLVEVLASQVGVTIGGHHLKDTVVDGQQGHIKGA